MKKQLLIASCAFGLVAPFASAEVFTVDGINYSLLEDGSGVEVAAASKEYKADSIIIPATVKNGAITYKVVAVAKRAFQYAEVAKIVLPNTVLSIGSDCFTGAEVKTIELGNSVEYLGDGCFGFNCEVENLSKLPASLVTIVGSPFAGCKMLKNVEVDEANPAYKAIDGVLYTKSGKTLVSYPYGHGNSYVIPEGVDSIGNNVFNTFQALEEITFPSTLKWIGNSAFTYCNNCNAKNDLPDGVKYIGGNAFSNARKMAITVPAEIEVISMTAFNNCYAMPKINVPGTVKVIGQQAFAACTAATELTLAEGLETISDFSLKGLTKVTNPLVIPSTVTEIGSYAFDGDKNIKKLDIGENVKTIGTAAFNSINPDTIIIRATVPPTYTNQNYHMIGVDCQATASVFVPDESIDAYKEAWIWKLFKNYQPLSKLAAVNDVVAEDAEVVAVAYYTLSGIQVAAPAVTDGQVYIVVSHYADGTVRSKKVLNR